MGKVRGGSVENVSFGCDEVVDEDSVVMDRVECEEWELGGGGCRFEAVCRGLGGIERGEQSGDVVIEFGERGV